MKAGKAGSWTLAKGIAAANTSAEIPTVQSAARLSPASAGAAEMTARLSSFRSSHSWRSPAWAMRGGASGKRKVGPGPIPPSIHGLENLRSQIAISSWRAPARADLRCTRSQPGQVLENDLRDAALQGHRFLHDLDDPLSRRLGDQAKQARRITEARSEEHTSQLQSP